ncbi:MAG: DNA cytosine methyltransferase, partial [Candidatus Heimdallarchaeota archaeon]|nr:DNA cytosine methyltransferase [Candidatus Heimdallarchaeota archaeon]
MSNNKKRLFKHIDFFSGAGGLSCGLEQAGFEPVFAIDIESVYAETYCLNNPNTKFLEGDIRKLKGGNLLRRLGVKKGEVELVAGGPPCQGFSINAPIR